MRGLLSLKHRYLPESIIRLNTKFGPMNRDSKNPQVCKKLETDLRSKGAAEVVTGFIWEKDDLIARFSPNTQPADIKFDATGRINRGIGIAIHNIIDLVVDGSDRHRSTNAKVHKPAFDSGKNAHWAGALNFGAEKSVQQAQIGARSIGNAAGSHAGGEVSLEVIGHFAFQNNMLGDVETNPSAYAEHVQIVGG